MTSKILVIDDDPATLNLLKLHLGRDRYVVLTAGSGPEGLRLAFEHKPDAVILDVRMPGMGGHEVCGRLRDISDAAILFVTVLKAPEDIVRGLELGADDYIIKPFNYEELLARLQACLRRRVAQRRRALAAGEPPSPWSLDPPRREVVQGDKRVQLTPKEYEVLQFFLNNPDKVLAADEILTQLWGPAYVGDPDLVKQFIYRLRSKLEDNPSEPRYFVTVRGAGYAFEPDTLPAIPKPPRGLSASPEGRPASVLTKPGAAHEHPGAPVRRPSYEASVFTAPASARGAPSSGGGATQGVTPASGLRRQSVAKAGRRSWTLRLGALAAALLVIFSGVGLAQASRDSLPGEWLYSVKRSVEVVRLRAARDPRTVAELRLNLVAVRVEEVEALVAANRDAQVTAAAASLDREVRELTGVLRGLNLQDASSAYEIAGRLEQMLSRHMTQLGVLERLASPKLGPAIRYAKDVSAQAWADASLSLQSALLAAQGKGIGPGGTQPGETIAPDSDTAGAVATVAGAAEAADAPATDNPEDRPAETPAPPGNPGEVPTDAPTDVVQTRPAGGPSPVPTSTPTSSPDR
jgi:DNA-binding response OmpR family regulator